MTQISAIIKKRYSCRTYSDRPIEDKILQEFSTLVNADHIGPFGNKPQFKLINLDAAASQRGGKLGTYGVIKNARLFLAGAIKDEPNAMEDYGYCKELLILKATDLGLGTCWLGGTFQSGEFANAFGLQEGYRLPTVSPLGYAAGKKSLTEKVMRSFADSNNRKPWSEIFFWGNSFTPLTPQAAGIYEEALENIRLAPSASNKQPWRILQDSEKNIFHFYLERSLQYKIIGIASLQDIDLGIAMSHFSLTVGELGLKGKWNTNARAPRVKSLDYITSWQGGN